MKIRQIEIKDFGSIKNKTLKFTSGLNVLYDEKEQMREEVRTFIEKMLFGNAEFPYAGVLWFESGGRNYRLTRDLHRETPYSELLCETSGELMDADRISDSKVAQGISESVFENAICIAPLKGNTGSEIVREVQRQIVGFQWSADRTVDLRRTSQRLKMTRKGYQVQVERRKKADQLEKGKVSKAIRRLREEISDLEDQKQQIGEQQSALKTSGDSNGFQMLDGRISELEKKNRTQIIIMCATVIAVFSAAIYMGMNMQTMVPAVLVGIAGALVFMAETNFEMRTVRELEKRKRMKSRWLAKQNKLQDGRNELDDELHEKNTALANLTEELQEMEEYAYLPLIDEIEIDSINYAMDTIEKLSARIYEKTGNRLVETMSEILRGITGGECRELLIDEDFHIRVDTGSDLVSIENLRLITVGQIYLSLRLAMGEILCGAEKLPVLLEEMFGAYDLENAAQTVTWLTGDQRQVIVSTGKKKELEILKNTGIACNTITI